MWVLHKNRASSQDQFGNGSYLFKTSPFDPAGNERDERDNRDNRDNCDNRDKPD
jgi:hypothetical protein